MGKTIRTLLPHAAILMANMYLVFFGIDRVNTAMNFIDNPYTKGVLLFMSLVTLCCAVSALRRAARFAKKAGRPLRRDRATRALARVSGALCALYPCLLLFDLLRPDLSLFLLSGVKWGLMFVSLVCVAFCASVAARDRKLLQKKLRKKSAARTAHTGR